MAQPHPHPTAEPPPSPDELFDAFLSAGMTAAQAHRVTRSLDATVALAVREALQVFEERMDGRFAQIDARFEQVDARFAQVEARFAQVEARFAQVDARLAMVLHELRSDREARKREREADLAARAAEREADLAVRASTDRSIRVLQWTMGVLIALVITGIGLAYQVLAS